MKKLFLFIVWFFSLNFVGLSQERKLQFVDQFEINQQSAVTFGIVGNLEKIDFEILTQKISSIKGITKCQFFYGRRCLVVYKENFDVFELRSILLSYNSDFDLRTVYTNDFQLANEMKSKSSSENRPHIQNPILPKDWVYPESYPKYPNSGNKENDEQIFQELKQQWKREYPEDYQKMTGVEYITDADYYELKKKQKKSSF